MQIEVKSTLPPNPTEEDVIELILHNRNIKFEEKSSNKNDHQEDQSSTWNLEHRTRNFFTPPHPTSLSLSDFGFDKEYIEKAMRLIWSLHKSDKPIIIYSDYDADGITGGAILWETLHNLGFKSFPYIGNRIEEGYGFSKTGLDAVKKKYDPSLVISVDHGIAALDMVRYAKNELNIPIIVTDHHHKQEDKVPVDAEAIFHIPALSGSGTAYYVAKEIVGYRAQGVACSKNSNEKMNESTPYPLAPSTSLAKLFAGDYIGLAAIGTIADLVPLVGPSRAIAKYGLEALTTTKRAGIEALKRVSGNLGKTITTYEVGFMIAPRINASGRLADALSALRLLCTRDTGKADAIAGDLQALNTERQDMVKKAVDEALGIVEAMRDKDGKLPKILIVYQGSEQRAESKADSNLTTPYPLHPTPSISWHEGIIGLIASKLVEKYHRPAIVLTQQGYRVQGVGFSKDTNEIMSASTPYSLPPTPSSYKASARSIPGFHLTDFLKNFAELLTHFGGHAAAAGLSISGSNLPIFTEMAMKKANELITDKMLMPSVQVDCELPLTLASLDLATEIESLAPFGMGNEKPKFVSSGTISNVQIFGKDNTHLRFRLISGSSYLDFIAFGKANLASDLNDHKEASLAYTLDINRWNGSEKLQAKLISLATI